MYLTWIIFWYDQLWPVSLPQWRSGHSSLFIRGSQKCAYLWTDLLSTGCVNRFSVRIFFGKVPGTISSYYRHTGNRFSFPPWRGHKKPASRGGGRLVIQRKIRRGGYGRFQVMRSRNDRQRFPSIRTAKKGHVSNSFSIFRYVAVFEASSTTNKKFYSNFWENTLPAARLPAPSKADSPSCSSRSVTILNKRLSWSDKRNRPDRRRSRSGRSTRGKANRREHAKVFQGEREPAWYCYTMFSQNVMFQTLSWSWKTLKGFHPTQAPPHNRPWRRDFFSRLTRYLYLFFCFY